MEYHIVNSKTRIMLKSYAKMKYNHQNKTKGVLPLDVFIFQRMTFLIT